MEIREIPSAFGGADLNADIYREMWTNELRDATIAGAIVSQEELGQAGFDWGSFCDADVILIDESHNFRNRTTQRYENIERIVSANGRRGQDGGRKKLIL